jgi:hypothetical protein
MATRFAQLSEYRTARESLCERTHAVVELDTARLSLH